MPSDHTNRSTCSTSRSVGSRSSLRWKRSRTMAGSIVSEYTTGTHHDAPFDDNRQVPVLVMGPGVGRATLAKASLLQVAPT